MKNIKKIIGATIPMIGLFSIILFSGLALMFAFPSLGGASVAAVNCGKGSRYNGHNCVKNTTTSKTPAPDTTKSDPTLQLNSVKASGGQCGGGDNAVKTSINFGCTGKGNAIIDILFALIRFLSYGVGLVIVGSMVVGGIQYTASRGDPQATAAAENRLRANVMALVIFLFAYALLNYIIPGVVLK